MPDIRSALAAELRKALTDRDTAAASALRTALAAIANAEAVPAASRKLPPGSQHVAGAVPGLGAAEIPRRYVAEAEIALILEAEIAEREEAAALYDGGPHAARAERLRHEADVLRGAVGRMPPE